MSTLTPFSQLNQSAPNLMGFASRPQPVLPLPNMPYPANLPYPPPTAPPLAPEIQQALGILALIRNLPGDEAYLRSMGIDIIFNNGQQALDVIRNKGIRVDFGDMGDSKAHAQWIAEQNLIMINQKYRGDFSKANLYAISEAIYHEAGHAARSGDNQASVQEELNCLGLNTLAYRYHSTIDPQFANTANSSRLIQDGVALYSRLFFDADPWKRGLVNRVIEKYGMLPASTPDHPIPVLPYQVPMADRVIRQIHTANTLNMLG